MKQREATVFDLSASVRAVVSFTPAGQPDTLTLIRGREAFALSGSELPKLRDGLEPRKLVGVDE